MYAWEFTARLGDVQGQREDGFQQVCRFLGWQSLLFALKLCWIDTLRPSLLTLRYIFTGRVIIIQTGDDNPPTEGGSLIFYARVIVSSSPRICFTKCPAPCCGCKPERRVALVVVEDGNWNASRP